MSKLDRTRNREKRENRVPQRHYELGYYYIVTDTDETEKNYFVGLHKSLPPNLQDKIVIKVIKSDTQDLIQTCLELATKSTQFRSLWIIFDRDQVKNFDQLIREAEKKEIHVGWSNPCFEIWMFAYFGKMPSIMTSWDCCKEFGELYERKTGKKYSKSYKDIYNSLLTYGDENIALSMACTKHRQHIKNNKLIPSEMCPCTTVYTLVKEIKNKTSTANKKQ